MSYVNAFYALTRNLQMGPSTPENISLLFFSAMRDQYDRNEPLDRQQFKITFPNHRVDLYFQDFPIINVASYDIAFGQNAAKRALDEYNRTPSAQRLDQNDMYKFSDLTKKIKARNQPCHRKCLDVICKLSSIFIDDLQVGECLGMAAGIYYGTGQNPKIIGLCITIAASPFVQYLKRRLS